MRSALAHAPSCRWRPKHSAAHGRELQRQDYLARFIHDCSSRAGGPYFAINCAALPPELAESELFGHESGAFTGARAAENVGLVELAEGGTLLLNEIGELSLPLQSKLLTFLDTHTFHPCGVEKERLGKREVDCGYQQGTLSWKLNPAISVRTWFYR